MEDVIAKIQEFNGFVVCEDASPENTNPVVFPRSMKIGEIRTILNEAAKEISEKFKGKKAIQRIQREEQMRSRFVRVGRMPGSKLHVFIFLRDAEAEAAKDRYEVVPVSLLSLFHKTFKLTHFTASVEERGEDAFCLREAQTAEGFQFPVVDARLWLRRHQKAQGITAKRPAEDDLELRRGKTLKKMKTPDGTDRPSLFTAKSPEEYERRKKLAKSKGLRVIAEPKTHELVDLTDLEDGEEKEGFEVIPGAQLGTETRPLCAEDFSAFTQPPMNNYFISMVAGLNPERTKAMAKSKVRWKQGASVWSPSTLMSLVARSFPRKRNFDAIVRSVIQNSEIAAGLNIYPEIPSKLVSGGGNGDNSDDVEDELNSEDIFGEDGTITDETLLLKHSKTLEELQDAILQLALEPYDVMLFSKTQ